MNLDKHLLALARKSRMALILTIGLGLAAGVFTVMQAGYLSRVVSRVFLGNDSLEDVASLLLILSGVILLRAALAWGSEVSANAIALRVKTVLRELLIEKLLKLGPAYTREERSGELTNTLVEGVEALDAYYSQYLPQLVLAALVPLTFLVFIFPLDPLSGMILALTAPLIPLFMALIGNYAKILTGRQWRSMSRISAYFLDVLQGLTTLKLLGRSKAQIGVIAEVSERFRQVTMSVLRVTFLSALVLEMVATLSTAVVAVEVGLRLLYGRLTFEQAFFVLLLAPEFYLPLRMLGTRFHAGMSGVEAAKRIFQVLESEVIEPGDAGQGDAQSLRKALERHDLSLTDIHFEYPDGSHALKGVNLVLKPGGVVALVGPSGAGKSTIADLLLQFVQPSRGELMIGDVPISQFDQATWRSQVGWVSQEPYLINDSVAANIRMGRSDASQEEIIWAAQQANADTFIRALPAGYDTLVGERGARLSAGQMQRIALARAFLRDAPLLILDEATANLDPQSEALILDAMTRLLVGRTTLMIAHRLQTVKQVDQIVVLDKGQIDKQGTHGQLLTEGGLYSRLVGQADSIEDLDETVPYQRLQRSSSEFIEEQVEDIAPNGTPRQSAWRTVSQLIRLIAPFKSRVALSVLLGFATIASSIGLMSSSAYIISAAALQPSIADLQLAIVGVRFFGIARGVFRYLERYVSHQVTFHLLARLRTWFYQALEPLAPARLMAYRSGDLLARTLGDIQTLENFYVRALAPHLVMLLVGLANGLFLASFNPRFAYFFWGVLLLAGVLVPWMGIRLSRNVGDQLVVQRASMQGALVDVIQGLADLLAYNQEQPARASIAERDRFFSESQHRIAHIGALQTALVGLLSHMGMLGVLVLGIPLVGAGELQGVYLAVVTLAAFTGFEAVLPLPTASRYLLSDIQAASRLFELVDAQPAVLDPEQPKALPVSINLIVRDLSFRYPQVRDSGQPQKAALPRILDRISFDLTPGKRLAVVGPSGAGKSTLVSVLLRFWDYEEGSILLGHEELKAYHQDDLRQRIAVVSQNTYLFNASLRDNLRIARPSATQEQIVQAVRHAHLHDFIESLPMRYDTWIGEHGARLSGGERQRLAIARALLRDAPLLILDEPTANLDGLTERNVIRTIQQLMSTRASLMITHRLVGMESIDEILVMDGGCIIERGHHTDLLSVDGLYRQLWSYQNQWLIE